MEQLNKREDLFLLTDTELLTSRADGDARRFGELYVRHVEVVFGFHLRRTSCPDVAADLTAETFAQAFSSRRRFRDTGAPVRAWLFQIARHQLSHYVRHEKVKQRFRKRLGIPQMALRPDEFERVEQLVDFAEIREELTIALASMPSAQAEAVQLRIGDQLPYSQIAQKLNCTEVTARARVSRGLMALADKLEPT